MPTTLVGAPRTLPAPPGRGWFVRVTHHEIQTLPETALLLLVHWRRHTWRDHTYHRHSYAQLQTWCGWTTDTIQQASLDRRTSRAINALIDAGLVHRRKNYLPEIGLSLPTYRVTPPGTTDTGHWEQLTHDALDALMALAQDTHTPAATMVRHWLTWRMLCGHTGQTTATTRHVATLIGCEPRLVTTIRHTLAAASLLTVDDRPGRPSIVRATTTPPQPQSGDPTADSPVTPTAPVPPPEEQDLSQTEQDPHIGPQDRDSLLQASAPTPATPPNKNHDHHTRAARNLVNAQHNLRHAPKLLRLQIINMLARRSRIAEAHGTAWDWNHITRHVTDRLDDALMAGELHGHECALIRQALANARADLMAPSPEPTSAFGPSRALVCTEPPRPTGPTLEDIAARPLSTWAVDDPDALVETRTIELARLTLDALGCDPATDIDHLFAQVLHALRGAPGWDLVQMFAVRRVREAVEQSRLEADWMTWHQDCAAMADPDLVSRALDSLQCGAPPPTMSRCSAL